MKNYISGLTIMVIMLSVSNNLWSQSSDVNNEFGITAGAFNNFPANQNYLKENISVFYLAPYVRTGHHEFSAGIVYPLQTHALYYSDSKIDSRLGAIAGYKFYIFNIYGAENLFIHYSLQYLRFSGSFDRQNELNNQTYTGTETDMYINNVIGLGYNLFFDSNERFGFYYTLDYIISQRGYNLGAPGFTSNVWASQFVWNNLSTQVGFIFKFISLNKKVKQ